VLAPYIARLRYPLATSVAVSLLAATMPGMQVLALDRTLGLLPFFVLGMKLGASDLRVLDRRGARPLAVVVLAAVALGTLAVYDAVRVDWVFFSNSYRALGVSALEGMAIRSGQLLLAAVMTAAVLALVPRRRTRMSPLGAASLYGYLLHGIVVWASAQVDVAQWLLEGPGLALFFAGWLLVTAVLCSWPVRRVTRPAVEPRVHTLTRGIDRRSAA
jgi:fucose 4-O-acetylase-like acetyltransferase